MGILSKYRVLDFGRFIAGPYCGALLADFGADVIRIEKVGGSEDRTLMPVNEEKVGASFLQMNRNKRSFTLNPRKPEGQEILAKLVKTADVVLANIPVAGLKAMGIDYDSLVKIKPDIILTTVSTFGSVGPYSERVGFDGLGQTMSGAAFLSGDETTPSRSIAPFVDFTTAMMSAYGTLLALMDREQTGEGQIVEGALLRSAMTLANSFMIEQALTNINRIGTGSRGQTAGPSDYIRAKDGWFLTQVVGDPIFSRWAHMIGKPELVEDIRFSSDEARGENAALLSELAQAHASDYMLDEILAIYEAAKVPAGPLYSPQQILDDTHVAASDFLQYVNYPGLERAAPLAKAPVGLSKNNSDIQMRPPLLGEHTDSLLRDLGYKSEEIEALRASFVV